MAELVVFHNPRCSKSRAALALLDERGAEYEVVRYLDDPPDRATLERILDALADEPAALVRAGDVRSLHLAPADHTTREAVLELLLAHPEVMQRPVVLRGDEAVIGRPTERVEMLLT